MVIKIIIGCVLGYIVGRLLMSAFKEKSKESFDKIKKTFIVIVVVVALIGTAMGVAGFIVSGDDRQDYYSSHWEDAKFEKQRNGDYKFKRAGWEDKYEYTEFDIYGKGKVLKDIGFVALFASLAFLLSVLSAHNNDEDKLLNAAEKYMQDKGIVMTAECFKCKRSVTIDPRNPSKPDNCPYCGSYIGYRSEIEKYCKQNKLFAENKHVIDPYISEDEFGTFQTPAKRNRLMKAAKEYVKDNYDEIEISCMKCHRYFKVNPRNPEKKDGFVVCPHCGNYHAFGMNIMERFIEENGLISDQKDLVLPYLKK